MDGWRDDWREAGKCCAGIVDEQMAAADLIQKTPIFPRPMNLQCAVVKNLITA